MKDFQSSNLTRNLSWAKGGSELVQRKSEEIVINKFQYGTLSNSLDSTFLPIFKIHWNNLKGLRIVKPKKKKKEPTNNLVFFSSSNIFLAIKKKLTERLFVRKNYPADA